MDNSSVIIYPVVIKEEEHQLYSATFPDLKGCFSQGKTLAQVIVNAQEALAIHFVEKQGDLSKASDIFDIQQKVIDGFVQMIAVDLDTYHLKKPSSKFVRKNLTIPEWLNDLSEKYDVNF